MVNNQISLWSSTQTHIFEKTTNNYIRKTQVFKIAADETFTSMIQQSTNNLFRDEYKNHPLLTYRRQIFKYLNISKSILQYI